MTGLGVADAEAASDVAADAEAVSLGVATEEAEAPASLAACWPHAASRALRPRSVPPFNNVRRKKSRSHGNVFLVSVKVIFSWFC